MANRFEIQISGRDDFSKSFEKLNRKLDNIGLRVDALKKREREVGQARGFEQLGRRLQGVDRIAGSLTDSLRTMTLPLGVLSGGGAIAGVAALGIEFAQLGFGVKRASDRIGISTTSLQSLTGAAQLFGIQREEMTNGLKSLGDTLEDALYGRNQEALLMLNRLGISIHKTKDGAIDSARAFRDLAGAISDPRLNPQSRALVARTFGIENLLPVLQRGKAGLSSLESQAARLGLVTDPKAIANADEFTMALNRLKASGSGLANTIGADLMPVMLPMLQSMDTWIEKNREATGSGIAHFVDDLGKKIGSLDFSTAAGSLAALVAIGKALPSGAVVGGGAALAAGATVGGRIYDRSLAGSRFADWLGDFEAMTLGMLGNEDARRAWESAHGRGAVGLRQNNPGNLRQWGAMPQVNGFAVFPNANAGLRAASSNLLSYSKMGINTITGIVNRWAPASDGNNVAAYISDLSKQTGFGPDQPLNLNDQGVNSKLLSAIVQHEQGQQPYSPDQIAQAVAQAIAANPPQRAELTVKADVPPWMKMRTTPGSGVRIANSMPSVPP